jgi:ABC-type antimicrobial peptide transport system permease subunit
MFKNYFKTAWRNIKKNKGFFTLNFIGLYISVAACLLIGLLIMHETSFDKSTNSNLSIYRIVKSNASATGKTYGPVTPYPLASALRAAMPDEKLISQIHFQKDDVISFDNKKFKEQNIVFADSVFPKLFSLTVKQGSIKRALAEPGFVILTETTAHKYFGNENPIGKRIKIANLIDLQVAAIIANAPSNSHLPYNMLVSYASLRSELIGGFPLNEWGLNASGFTYIGLSNANQQKQVGTALASIANENLNAKKDGTTTTFNLQPLPDIHYNQLYAGSNPSYTINYSYLYLIGAIGLFLIFAACINYTNLSTALAIKKSKEVGVRKTMGATRSHLIKQFLSETFLLTALVFIAAALSVRLFLPPLNNFLDKNIPLNWLHLNTSLILIGLWITVSLLSGLYPSLVLSGFNPITALKSKIITPKASVITLRRGLVVFQFLTAQILIIGAIVVAKQMHYVQSKPLGFTKNNVVDIGLPENKPEQLRLLKDKLASIPGVSSISFSLGAPVTDNNAFTSFNLKEKFDSEKKDVEVKAIDKNYLSTYNLQLAAGRWFDNNDEHNIDASIPDSLKRYALVLNETAVKALGFSSAQNALGKYVRFGINYISAPVIGVVKDYNTASLHDAVKPVLMVEFPFFYYDAGIKLNNGYSAQTLAAIEKAWTSVYPQNLFESSFLDEHIASLYKNEKRTQQIFNLFTFLSIIINVLGLVGLLSFMVEQKTKEIGIRKVLGASIKDISFILSKDFLKLIIVAFFMAAPVAWILMNKWLQDFAYRTAISWWVFAVAVIAALVVTCIAVGFQTIKAAIANPVKSLRTE